MDCSFDISVDHDGGLSCFKEKIRKARKVHTCGECGKEIEPGEQYEYVSGIFEDRPVSHKTCLDCKSLRDVFFQSWIYSQLWDDFWESFRGEVVPESCISELTPWARAKVCDLIEQWDVEGD